MKFAKVYYEPLAFSNDHPIKSPSHLVAPNYELSSSTKDLKASLLYLH